MIIPNEGQTAINLNFRFCNGRWMSGAMIEYRNARAGHVMLRVQRTVFPALFRASLVEWGGASCERFATTTNLHCKVTTRQTCMDRASVRRMSLVGSEWNEVVRVKISLGGVGSRIKQTK